MTKSRSFFVDGEEHTLGWLSRREQEFLQHLLDESRDIKEIAHAMGICTSTLRSMASRLACKLNVKGLRGLHLWTLRNRGCLRPETGILLRDHSGGPDCPCVTCCGSRDALSVE